MGLFDAITLKDEMKHFLLSSQKLASFDTPITQIRYTNIWMELLQNYRIEKDVNESIRLFYDLPANVQALFNLSTSIIPYANLVPLINQFIIKEASN